MIETSKVNNISLSDAVQGPEPLAKQPSFAVSLVGFLAIGPYFVGFMAYGKIVSFRK